MNKICSKRRRQLILTFHYFYKGFLILPTQESFLTFTNIIPVMWNAASNFHLVLTIAQEAYLFYEIISGFIYAQADLSAVSLY